MRLVSNFRGQTMRTQNLKTFDFQVIQTCVKKCVLFDILV